MSGLASSLIAAGGLLIAALITFVLNRKLQNELAWRTEKLGYYKDLFDALAQNVEGMATKDTHREFARASNNILLIASPRVIEAHQAYREHIAISNIDRVYELDSSLLAALLNAIRDDLQIPGGAALTDNHARLWTSRRPR